MKYLIFSRILSAIPKLNPWVFVVITILSSMYIFWKLCARTRKNNSSVFDTFFIGSFFAILIGRISYIISNISDFNKYIWYWLPYEKYGEEIFLFRVLPWRFFRIWDMGLEIPSLLLGFVLGCTLWVLVAKKWKWSHLYIAIYASGFTLLLFSLISIGKITSNVTWISYGVTMFVILITWYIIRGIFIKIVIGIKEMKLLLITDTIFVIVSSMLILYMYISKEVTILEKITLIILAIWVYLGLLNHIADTRKATVTIEKVSSVRQVSINDIKQQIRIRK